MFTGVFKDRSSKERTAKESQRDLLAAAEQALAELLASRELRSYPLSRQCEIGPFHIDYVFLQRSLIVELLPAALTPDSASSNRHQARIKFLNTLGYVVFGVSPQEILQRPQRVLAKLCATLESC